MMTRPKKKIETPLPTDAELEILQILWDRGPLTVREAHEGLPAKTTGYTTVLKQLQVMAGKGLVTRNERFRSHLYEATELRKPTEQRLIADFVRRAFSGSAKNLVLGALSSHPVSAEEMKQIKRAIREVEERES